MALGAAYLDTVRYLEGKGRIIVLFKSLDCDGKETKIELDFIPELRLPPDGAFKNFLGMVSPQGLVFREAGKGISACSKSFYGLQALHSLLSVSFNASVPLPDPERQFLLSRDWSYFDKFSILERQEGVFVERKGLAEESINSPCFPESVGLEKAFLSNLLLLPCGQMPCEKETGLLFLENAAFRNFSLMPPAAAGGRKDLHWKNSHNLIELDFSRALLEKIAASNLGFDSINCCCCKPDSINAGNVLSSSLVEVEFLENGFYFDSMIQSFARGFHERSAGKSARLARKREFCLEGIPVGPFYCGQPALVPLADALRLLRNGMAGITGKKSEIKWHCRKKASFVAGAISSLLSLESALKKRILEIERKDLSEKGLNAFNPFFSDPKKASLEGFRQACSCALDSVFSCITAGHFSGQNDFLEAVEAINSGLLCECNELLGERNSEPIYSVSGRAFIKRMEAFTELAVVSRGMGIPLPSVHYGETLTYLNNKSRFTYIVKDNNYLNK